MDNLLENELLGKTLHPGTDYQAEKKIIENWKFHFGINHRKIETYRSHNGGLPVKYCWIKKTKVRKKISEKKKFEKKFKKIFVATSNMHRPNE